MTNRLKFYNIPIIVHSYLLYTSLTIVVLLSLPSTALPTEGNSLQLLGIQYIDDRKQEYPDWDVPQGYDMTTMFGTYQVDVVHECSEQVALMLGRWAKEYAVSLIKESEELHRFVIHANLPEQDGIIVFLYRVFRKPPRARFTAEYIDRGGNRELTSELGSKLVHQYQLAALASRMRREMRCLKNK